MEGHRGISEYGLASVVASLLAVLDQVIVAQHIGQEWAVADHRGVLGPQPPVEVVIGSPEEERFWELGAQLNNGVVRGVEPSGAQNYSCDGYGELGDERGQDEGMEDQIGYLALKGVFH